MGKDSGIEWTDHTFNPWWGCAKVSAACDHCYAEAWAKRTGAQLWGADAERRFFGDKHWAAPIGWAKRALERGVRERVFCASMADVCEDRNDIVPQRERLWRLIDLTGYALDWLLLTKRPENARRMMPRAWATSPPSYVWWGTTVEHQAAADERIPLLLQTPAAVRFLSVEPLLGPVDLGDALHRQRIRPGLACRAYRSEPDEQLLPRVDWVIVGGESGSGARPMHPDWVTSLRDACREAGVPFFFKQWGEWVPDPCGDVATLDRVLGAREVAWIDEQWVELTGGHRERPNVETHLYRLGKKHAGRLLDGVTYSELPEAPQAEDLLCGPTEGR